VYYGKVGVAGVWGTGRRVGILGGLIVSCRGSVVILGHLAMQQR
jgi:hypothetical protein